MTRRAGYAKRRPVVEQPAPSIETPAQAEEALSVDDAIAKQAAAKDADEKRRQRFAVEHAESKAAVAQATKDVEDAQRRKADKERREKAATLPARLDAQRAVTDARQQRVQEITRAQREAYAVKVKGWVKLVERRNGWAVDFAARHRPLIEKLARQTYERTPSHWSSALRVRMDRAAGDAQKLLARLDQTKESYATTLAFADACIRTGPPRTDHQIRQERSAFYAIGMNGNGFDELRGKPHDRPRFDWVVDPEITNAYNQLIDTVDAIERAAATIPADAVQPQDVRPISGARQDERAAVQADMRKRVEHEKSRSPVEKQKRAEIPGAAYGLTEF